MLGLDYDLHLRALCRDKIGRSLDNTAEASGWRLKNDETRWQDKRVETNHRCADWNFDAIGRLVLCAAALLVAVAAQFIVVGCGRSLVFVVAVIVVRKGNLRASSSLAIAAALVDCRCLRRRDADCCRRVRLRSLSFEVEPTLALAQLLLDRVGKLVLAAACRRRCARCADCRRREIG